MDLFDYKRPDSELDIFIRGNYIIIQNYKI